MDNCICEVCKIAKVNSRSKYKNKDHKSICRSCAMLLLFKNKTNHPRHLDGRTNRIVYCSDCGKKLSKGAFLRGITRCLSCARKALWADPDYHNRRQKEMHLAAKISPNKPEQLLINLLNELFPEKYKFVGDGQLWIAGYNPDFVHNTAKKCIEYNGKYFHSLPGIPEKDTRKYRTLAQLGYEVLVLEDDDLLDTKQLTEKLIAFHNQKA